jgi:hypothetical protein
METTTSKTPTFPSDGGYAEMLEGAAASAGAWSRRSETVMTSREEAPGMSYVGTYAWEDNTWCQFFHAATGKSYRVLASHCRG